MIHTTSIKNFQRLTLLLMMQILTSSIFPQSKNDFGNKDWISNGLAGKIYLLPENTQMLPNFDTMKPAGTIYTKELNIPNHSWTEGFPGVTDRFEWFGIEYKGTFAVKKAGHYTFQISSDDGSKLFIDDKLVIDNDGLHSQRTKNGKIDLDGSVHKIKVQYFQGPRTEIGLQLFVRLDNEKEETFPGTYFKLSTPKKIFLSGLSGSILLMISILLMLLIFFLLFLRNKRKSHNKLVIK